MLGFADVLVQRSGFVGGAAVMVVATDASAVVARLRFWEDAELVKMIIVQHLRCPSLLSAGTASATGRKR